MHNRNGFRRPQFRKPVGIDLTFPAFFDKRLCTCLNLLQKEHPKVAQVLKLGISKIPLLQYLHMMQLMTNNNEKQGAYRYFPIAGSNLKG
jgi:hypothetical protein